MLALALMLAITSWSPRAFADSPHADGHTYAVLVGVADYPSSPLPRTDVDAQRIADALRAQVPADRLRMHLLLNGDATRANLDRALAEVARDATERDEFIFFFSGHGGTQPDETNGDEGDGVDETLVLFDGDITDDELARQMDPVKSRMSIVALDSCFSGGFLFDVGNERGRMAMFSSDEDLTSAVPSEEAGGWLSLYLAEALEGRADGAADGASGQGLDGQLTALEIEMYVHDRFRTQQRISASDPAGRDVGYQLIDIKRTGVSPDMVFVNLTGDVQGGVSRNVVLERTGVTLPGQGAFDQMPIVPLTLEAGHTYVVETFGLEGATDTVLELRRGNGAPNERDATVAENDDAGGSLASRVRITASEGGSYYARVRPYSPQTGGTFGLRVIELVEGPGAPSRNVVLEQRGVNLPGSMESSALPRFEIDAVAGRTYVIETSNLAGSTDTVLRLERNGTVLAENDDAGGTLASRIRWTADTDGRVSAIVRPYAPSTGGTFNITVTEQGGPSAGPTVSPTPTPTPMPTPAPTPANNGGGTVHFERRGVALPGTNDFAALPVFEMQLEAGRTYTIETFDLAGSTDTVLSLRRSSGGAPSPGDTVVAENDDANGTLASAVTFTPNESGAYYAHVRPYAPQTGGTFGLRVIER